MAKTHFQDVIPNGIDGLIVGPRMKSEDLTPARIWLGRFSVAAGIHSKSAGRVASLESRPLDRLSLPDACGQVPVPKTLDGG